MQRVVGFSIEEPGLQYRDTIKLLDMEFAATAVGNPRRIVELVGQQAEGLRRLSRLREAQALFSKALLIAQNSGIEWARGWAHWGIGSVLRAEGSYVLSAAHFKAATEAATRSNDRRCLLWSIAGLAELDRMAGRSRNALRTHKSLVLEFRSIGDVKGVCWASLGIAQIFRVHNDFEKADAEFSRSRELSSNAGHPLGEAWALRGQAEIARESGDYSLSIELASAARSMFSSVGYRLGAAYALKTQTDSLVQANKLDDALASACVAQKEFVLCGEHRGIAFSLLSLGNVWAHLKETSRATSTLRQSQLLLYSSKEAEPQGFSPTRELSRFVR